MAAACQPDLALPPGAEVACGPAAPCPEGYACNEVVGRCVAVGGGDRQPPEVVAGSVRVEPALAGRGQPVRVTFDVDEPLAFPPQVGLALARERPFARLDEPGDAWAFSYAPAGGEPDGEPVGITALLVDRAGNVARDVALGTVTFDFTAPGVARIEPVGHGRATRDGRVVVEVALDEATPEPPGVWLAETGAALALEPGTEPPVYRFVYGVGDGDEAGSYGVRVAAADAVGNRAEAVAADIVVLDFTPPGLAGVPEVVSPVARRGTIVAVQLEVDEPLAGGPTVTLRAGEERVLPLHKGEQVGERYLYAVEVGEGDDGTWDVAVEGLRDLAGNPGETWTGPGLVRIDGTRPEVVGEPPFDKDPPHYREGDRIRLDLTVSEELGPQVPRLRLATRDPLTLPCEPAGDKAWVCTLERVLDGREEPTGLVPVTIDLEDEAGNTTSSGTVVTLDFEGPRLAWAAGVSRCDGREQARVADDEVWVRAGLDCGEGGWPVRVTFALDGPSAAETPPAVHVAARPLERLEGEALAVDLVSESRCERILVSQYEAYRRRVDDIARLLGEEVVYRVPEE